VGVQTWGKADKQAIEADDHATVIWGADNNSEAELGKALKLRTESKYMKIY